MTPLFALFLFLAAAPPPSSLDQVKAEPNPDHRAKAAIDYGAVAEKNAETAYSKGDMQALAAELKNVEETIEAAKEALTATGKTPGRNPTPYKYAEMHSRELLVRLSDLKERMDASERNAIDGVIDKVQEIHDAWFEGIMGKKK
jgi:septal ring factor EnvC (AmiA/AmiB activator)